MKSIKLLGSTGTVGVRTLDIIRQHPDFFSVKVLTAKKNYKLLLKQAIEFKPEIIVIEEESGLNTLKRELEGKKIRILHGKEGLAEATKIESDISVIAIVGAAAIEPTYELVSSSNILGYANKESIVCAGSLILNEAEKKGCKIIPIDSEHSAIFQSLELHNKDQISHITLTASGGPFLNTDAAILENVSISQALNHPNWKMGQKITIDSATMMNKALEVIEAFYLFNLKASQIEVVVHPESIIHGLVTYNDGNTIAQLGLPDMITPIAYSLFWPQRCNLQLKKLDLVTLSNLTFQKYDAKKFPSIDLGFHALSEGGIAPIVLNAANEVAVELFLKEKIKFTEIFNIVETAMSKISGADIYSIDEVLKIDDLVRSVTLEERPLMSEYM